MKFKIKKRYLYKFLQKTDAIGGDEAKLTIYEGGWMIRGVDPAHCCMSNTRIHKFAFEEFTTGQEEEFEEKIGIDIPKIMNLLKLLLYDDEIEIKIYQEDDYIQFKSGNLKDNERLIDTTILTDPNEIRLQHKFEICKIPNADLRDFIALSKTKTDNIIITILDGKTLKIHTDEEWEEDVMLKYNKERDNILICEKKFEETKNRKDPGKTFKSNYALDYLETISKTFHKNETIDKIKLSKDYPIEFYITEEDGKVETQFILAPRIEAN